MTESAPDLEINALQKAADVAGSLVMHGVEGLAPGARARLDKNLKVLGLEGVPLSDIFLRAAQGDVSAFQEAINLYQTTMAQQMADIEILHSEIRELEDRLALAEKDDEIVPANILRKLNDLQDVCAGLEKDKTRLSEEKESLHGDVSFRDRMIEKLQDALAGKAREVKQYKETAEEKDVQLAERQEKIDAFTDKERGFLSTIQQLNLRNEELNERFTELSTLVQSLSTANARFFATAVSNVQNLRLTAMRGQKHLGNAQELGRTLDALANGIQEVVTGLISSHHGVNGVHRLYNEMEIPDTTATLAAIGAVTHKLEGDKPFFDGFRADTVAGTFHSATGMQMDLIGYLLGRQSEFIHVHTGGAQSFRPYRNPEMFRGAMESDDALFVLSVRDKTGVAGADGKIHNIVVRSSHTTDDDRSCIYYSYLGDERDVIDPAQLRICDTSQQARGRAFVYQNRSHPMCEVRWGELAAFIFFIVQKDSYDLEGGNVCDGVIGGLHNDPFYIAGEKKPLGLPDLFAMANTGKQALPKPEEPKAIEGRQAQGIIVDRRAKALSLSKK